MVPNLATPDTNGFGPDSGEKTLQGLWKQVYTTKSGVRFFTLNPLGQILWVKRWTEVWVNSPSSVHLLHCTWYTDYTG